MSLTLEIILYKGKNNGDSIIFLRDNQRQIDRQTRKEISIRKSCPKYDALYIENVRNRYRCLMIYDINFTMTVFFLSFLVSKHFLMKSLVNLPYPKFCSSIMNTIVVEFRITLLIITLILSTISVLLNSYLLLDN